MNWPSQQKIENYITRAEVAVCQFTKLSKSTYARPILKIGIIMRQHPSGWNFVELGTAGFDVMVAANNTEALEKGLDIVHAN